MRASSFRVPHLNNGSNPYQAPPYPVFFLFSFEVASNSARASSNWPTRRWAYFIIYQGMLHPAKMLTIHDPIK